jgi:type III pantothenate kinase
VSANLLLLDVGNSRAKWLLFDGQGAMRRGAGDIDALADSVGSGLGGAQVLIASVADDRRNATLAAQLQAQACAPWFARPLARLEGLVNSYAEPARMGVDRWLAMLAAQRRTPERCCVVDAGSALTIDFVSAGGEHEGGFIIPGADLMRRALFADTDRVRFDTPTPPALTPGRSTAEAVANGLLLAQAGAVCLALQSCGNGMASSVFLCGGGAAALQPVLQTFAPDHALEPAPDLVFEGLLIQARAEGVLSPAFPASIARLAARRPV